MLQTQPDIEALSGRLLRIFPALDPSGQRLSLALYRELAHGAPVSPSSLADRVEMPAETVVRQLRSWPGSARRKSIVPCACSTSWVTCVITKTKTRSKNSAIEETPTGFSC